MLEKVNPLGYITDVDPVDEPIMNASDWYETEERQIGGTTSTNDQIPWMLAQGWSITDTVSELRKTPIMWDSSGTEIGWKTTYLVGTKLQRRSLKSEFALNELIKSFTNAYNEGRTLNDSRYDELVTLYCVMLDKTEDEIISGQVDPEDFTVLVDDLIAEMRVDYDEVKADLDGGLDDYGDAQRARVNTQFDNQLITAKADLITRGLYNTTIWDSLETGIERERAFALTDLEDSIVDRQLALRATIYGFKENLTSKILDAQLRLKDSLRLDVNTTTTLRNQVFQAMLSFMERREDGYPDLNSIAQLTTSLGSNTSQVQAP